MIRFRQGGEFGASCLRLQPTCSQITGQTWIPLDLGGKTEISEVRESGREWTSTDYAGIALKEIANVGVAADTVACFAGSRPSFARLALRGRSPPASPGLVLQDRVEFPVDVARAGKRHLDHNSDTSTYEPCTMAPRVSAALVSFGVK